MWGMRGGRRAIEGGGGGHGVGGRQRERALDSQSRAAGCGTVSLVHCRRSSHLVPSTTFSVLPAL